MFKEKRKSAGQCCELIDCVVSEKIVDEISQM